MESEEEDKEDAPSQPVSTAKPGSSAKPEQPIKEGKTGQQNKKEAPAPKTSNAKKAKSAPAKETPAVNEEKKPTSAKPANPYKKSIERNKLNHNRRVRSDKKRGLV